MHEYIYRDGDGIPLQACPECGGDLTAEGGIELVLSVAGTTVEVRSQLDDIGQLKDTDDGMVAQGRHSATNCGHCGNMLANMDGVHEVQF